MFDYPFIAGNPATALDKPNSVVVTETAAQKLFGSADAVLGKFLNMYDTSYQVTEVFSPQKASHLEISMLFPTSSMSKEKLENYNRHWGDFFSYTFIQLYNSDQAVALQVKLPQFLEHEVRPIWGAESTDSLALHLQNLPDVYFLNDWSHSLEVGNKSYIYLFAAVAVFILLIASINYINLATARSAKRAKGVGMRKTVGAYRSQIIFQFLIESVFLTLIATVLALVLVELILPAFNAITGESISSGYLFNPSFVLAILILVLFIGIVAGSYPALFLSHYNPTEVLKSNQIPKRSNAILRKGLVVIQFTFPW